MKDLKALRWQQRFSNFDKSFKLLESYVKIKDPTEIERAGGIQFFEMTFELAWKTLKDYLESEKFEVKSPRQTIKLAFQIGMIENGHDWMDGLDDRNLTTHTYNEETAEDIEAKIKKKYFPMLKKLHKRLKQDLKCLD